MEVPQGNSPYSYLKQSKMSCFSCIKFKNKRAKQVLPGGVGIRGKGVEMEKWWRGNMVQILCAHICKWKNDIC
jgi:hypothetical protein